MANKILVARGTKARIEAIKSTLATNELVYAVDTGELGVKKANGSVEYFMNARVIEGIVDGLMDLLGSKVNKVVGKGLSTNDYTDADKSKVDSIDAKDADTLQAAKDYTDVLGADVLELQGKVEDIEDGTTVVKRAEQDEDGNSIKDTYATLADLAIEIDDDVEVT